MSCVTFFYLLEVIDLHKQPARAAFQEKPAVATGGLQ